jgi:hypothetical protein
VKARPGSDPNTVDWDDPDIRFIPPGNGHASGKDIHLTAQGDAEIIFDLDDSSHLHLRFRQDKSDAIWIAADKVCPPPAPGDGNGEFDIVDRQNKKVTIIDRNQTEGDFSYALRFDSDAGLQVYDPIIKNGL